MDYKPTIGIEIHCELKTKTKMFSNSLNNYGSSANSNISSIDLALPGTLPTVNKKAIDLSLKAALLLNCKINKIMHFDRKNYFYPDLAKGYQITQARTPIGYDGYVEINVNGENKKIGIHDIHIEEDTAKSNHFEESSLLDFNRAGVPLIEIVTKPDIKSKEEAVAYVNAIKELMLYANISDCKMEEGSMRCDVNVSISKNETLGTRIEVKNISSVSNVALAIEYEVKRQKHLLNNNIEIKEETRRFDDKENETILMRVKETGNDYRYFPEPDIPFITLTDEIVEKSINEIPVLPHVRRVIYKEAGILDVNIEKIIQNKEISDFLLKVENKDNLIIMSNLLLGDISSYLNKQNRTLSELPITLKRLENVADLVRTNKLNSKLLKDILNDIIETNKEIDIIISEKGIVQIKDEELLEIINNVLSTNQESIKDYKEGKDRAIKYLMGQIMKETKGSADPIIANKLLIKELNR